MKLSALCKLFLICGFTAVLLVAPLKIFAATFTLQSSQSTLSPSDDYSVNATLSIGASNGTTYYLRGVFYKPGTSNYCGFTYNGSDYFNGPYANNGWTQLLPITVQNSSWSGTLQAQLDPDDAGCSQSGIYNFKIERYTASGSTSFDNQNELTLSVIIPTDTPTPQPTILPTSSPTPTFKPTPTPTGKPLSTTKPSPTKNPSPSLTVAISSIDAVLGTASAISPTLQAKPTLIAGIKENNSIDWLGIFFLVVGVVLLISCGILWRKQLLAFIKKGHENSYEKL